MSEIYSTEDIARDVAERMGFGSDHPLSSWRAYHPIVKATVEWLEERNFLAIVADPPTGDDAGEGP